MIPSGGTTTLGRSPVGLCFRELQSTRRRPTKCISVAEVQFAGKSLLSKLDSSGCVRSQ